MSKVAWPEGKRFAFSIFDDTDFAQLHNVRPVYSLLFDLGFRTTKSVWPIKGSGLPLCEGATCEDEDYLNWLYELKGKGFELGYHMATYHTSPRSDTERALERFKSYFGAYPKTMANHSGCRENLYWGDARLSGIYKLAYNLLTRFKHKGTYRGHVDGDPLFWGDLCKERISYVRNFVYGDINSLKMCPDMPYHDPARPYVTYWYASSEGPEVHSFNTTLAEENQDRLEEEGGACIMYTHLACGFFEQDAINKRFEALMKRLSRKNGWFVPVGALLDYLLEAKGETILSPADRRRLEGSWLKHKLKVGHS